MFENDGLIKRIKWWWTKRQIFKKARKSGKTDGTKYFQKWIIFLRY